MFRNLAIGCATVILVSACADDSNGVDSLTPATVELNKGNIDLVFSAFNALNDAQELSDPFDPGNQGRSNYTINCYYGGTINVTDGLTKTSTSISGSISVQFINCTDYDSGTLNGTITSSVDANGGASKAEFSMRTTGSIRATSYTQTVSIEDLSSRTQLTFYEDNSYRLNTYEQASYLIEADGISGIVNYYTEPSLSTFRDSLGSVTVDGAVVFVGANGTEFRLDAATRTATLNGQPYNIGNF